MKIECSAGHKYDIGTLAGRMQCGDRKPGQRCGMVLTYDRMHGSTYCRRVLKEVKPTTIKIKTCPKCQGDGCNPEYSGDPKRPIKMVACDCPAGRAWHGERGHIPANVPHDLRRNAGSRGANTEDAQ